MRRDGRKPTGEGDDFSLQTCHGEYLRIFPDVDVDMGEVRREEQQRQRQSDFVISVAGLFSKAQTLGRS